MKDKQPAFDAEQISPNHLKEFFQRPPGMKFYPPPRSTLLVGSRGSGKTILLRNLRHNEEHFCIYGDLRKILSGVSADVGGGGISFKDIRPSDEGFIMSKTVARSACGQLVNAEVEKSRYLQIFFPALCLSERLKI